MCSSINVPVDRLRVLNTFSMLPTHSWQQQRSKKKQLLDITLSFHNFRIWTNEQHSIAQTNGFMMHHTNQSGSSTIYAAPSPAPRRTLPVESKWRSICCVLCIKLVVWPCVLAWPTHFYCTSLCIEFCHYLWFNYIYTQRLYVYIAYNTFYLLHDIQWQLRVFILFWQIVCVCVCVVYVREPICLYASILNGMNGKDHQNCPHATNSIVILTNIPYLRFLWLTFDEKQNK